MTPICVMPFGPHRDEPITELPSAYILSLIAPTRLRVALPRELESALNAEWSRRRRAEVSELKARRRAA